MFSKEMLIILPEEENTYEMSTFHIKKSIKEIVEKYKKTGMEFTTINVSDGLYLIEDIKDDIKLINVVTTNDSAIIKACGYEVNGPRFKENQTLIKLKQKALEKYPFELINSAESMFYAAKKRVDFVLRKLLKEYTSVLVVDNGKRKLINVTPKSVKDSCLLIRMNSYGDLRYYYNGEEVTGLND